MAIREKERLLRKCDFNRLVAPPRRAPKRLQRSVGVLRGLLPSDNCAAPIGIQYIFHIHSEKLRSCAESCRRAPRQNEIPKAEQIIKVYKEEFNDWLNNRKLVPAINALKESLEAIQKDEINFHKKKIKNFDETQAELLTNRFIQKITTQFVKHLKEEKTSVTDSIQVMSKVFGKS